MNTIFTVEESNLICVFAGEDRNEVIKDIERALPHLNDRIWRNCQLSHKEIEKLQSVTDEEFAKLELIAAE